MVFEKEPTRHKLSAHAVENQVRLGIEPLRIMPLIPIIPTPPSPPALTAFTYKPSSLPTVELQRNEYLEDTERLINDKLELAVAQFDNDYQTKGKLLEVIAQGLQKYMSVHYGTPITYHYHLDMQPEAMSWIQFYKATDNTPMGAIRFGEYMYPVVLIADEDECQKVNLSGQICRKEMRGNDILYYYKYDFIKDNIRYYYKVSQEYKRRNINVEV